MLQTIVNGLAQGIPFALMALGFALVYNTTKVFHIAVVGVWSFATYMYYWFSVEKHLSVFVSVAIAVVICMALSILIDLVVYRPLYRKKATASVLMIASIGVLTIIDSIVLLVFGNNVLTPRHLDGLGPMIGSIDIQADQLRRFVIGLPIILVFLAFLRLSGWGSRFRAISTDEILFASLGYNPMRVRNMAFVLSGGFAALSSCLLVCGNLSVRSYTEGLDYFVLSLAAMVIGGTNRYEGCLMGGLFVGLVQEFSKVIWKDDDVSWLNLIVFGLAAMLLLLKRQGLVGYKQRSV